MSVSLGLSGFLSQGSYAQLLLAFKIKQIYIGVVPDCYYPLTTLHNALHVMVK